MKRFTVLLLVLFASIALAQDKFPTGFNPDGKIGNPALTLFGGLTTTTGDWKGYHAVGRFDFPVDPGITIFVVGEYTSLSYHGSSILNIPDQTSTSISFGFRVFGGM